ncbi:exodeoxyribonuclease III [Neglectibacter caecimuris]|uniref:exodeoxyribonuclease III n=1 Tax=Neglectibacter caecimuris TaxID=3093658 RepID=UPI002AC8DD91|nr:exodeoxyribonuclease III [Neglectibacter sp. M00184]
MKLISWNVNGLRACMGKGFAEFLQAESPNVICLQETKMQKEQADFEFPGYFEYWNSSLVRKGYSGTAVFSKTEPLSVTYGIGVEEFDGEGRVIAAEYSDFILVTVYTPNSQRELTRLSYRMEFEDAFRAYLGSLREKKPVIVCGDMNVAHRPIDLKNPKPNVGNAGFTYEERGKFSELLASGFLDTFRYFYPELEGAYSWWSYMYHSRENNAGWRIDYFLADERLKERLSDSLILSQVPGSDHCPVELLLKD